MINTSSIYFLLYLLLITGGSAAMAKNEYGITLMALSFAGFAVTSFIETVFSYSSGRKTLWQKVEITTVFIVFTLIVLQINLVQFPLIELLFTITGLLLSGLYVSYLLGLRKGIGNKRLSYFLSSFYFSIATFLFAMAINPISANISLIINWIAIGILVISLGLALQVRTVVVREKEVSLAKYLGQLANKSVLIVFLFALFGLYQGFSTTNLLPDIHSSMIPDGYYQLVENAANSSSSEDDMKYEEFKQKMDAFMQRRGLKE